MWWMLVACAPFTGSLGRLPELDPQSGGQASVDDQTVHAYALAIRGLERSEQRAFSVGNAFFNDNWVSAPASTEGRDGLGPLFNARSCSSCHFKDGRAAPVPGQAGFLLRLRLSGEGVAQPDPVYGGQIQDFSIVPETEEAAVHIDVTDKVVTYPDGQQVTMHVPSYRLSDLRYGELHPETVMSPRVAPAVFGLGLLAAIPEATLTALEDVSDRNNDGISGRINRLADGQVGRFGWKADVPSLIAQTTGAFVHDMGITSTREPDHPHTEAQVALDELPHGGLPEVDDQKVDRIVGYLERIAVPYSRDVDGLEVRKGRRLFSRIGCDGCHIPELRTGVHAVSQLSEQRIQPYTDLLLHDMGADLADGFASHTANGQEWRTPPLWGLGLMPVVNGHTRLLHDGRAHSIEEAIVWHGGEAMQSREAFMVLDVKERSQVLRFLESL